MNQVDRPTPRIPERIDAQTLAGHLPTIVTALAPALQRQRWFGGKSREVTRVAPRDWVVVRFDWTYAVLSIVDVFGGDDTPSIYWVPLLVRPADQDSGQSTRETGSTFLRVEAANGPFDVVDAMRDDRFIWTLLERIEASTVEHGQRGEFRFRRTTTFDDLVRGPATGRPAFGSRSADGSATGVRPLGVDQSNTSVAIDDRVILKAFRRLANGVNPEVEVTEFLTTRTTFRSAPLVAGAIEYRASSGERFDVGVLHQFIPNYGDGWSYLLARLRQIVANPDDSGGERLSSTPSSDASSRSDRPLREVVHDHARQLGQITAQLHAALASDVGDPAFAPEPYRAEDLEGVVAGLQSALRSGLERLATARTSLSDASQANVELLLGREQRLRESIVGVADRVGNQGRGARGLGHRIRGHGDFHLGQVLKTADGFVIVDFEGEPARTLDERRAKTSPMRDVAGMARSFHYLAAAAAREGSTGAPRSDLAASSRTWGQVLEQAFFDEYCRAIGVLAPAALPVLRQDVEALFRLFSLEKALYELGYELDNRPDWVDIPLEWLARYSSG